MTTMYRLYIIISLVLTALFVKAQENTSFDPSGEPTATALLESFEQFVDDHPELYASFSLLISIPGETPQSMTGSLYQSMDKYLLQMEGYSITSNGVIRWVYDSTNNEVNLYNAKTQSGPATPLDYLSLYKDENFSYRLADEYAGKDEHCIEFKPTEKYSDYSKFRITFGAITSTPKRIEIFEKGGIRTDMRVTEITVLEEIVNKNFEFDLSRYPNIHIEDLRID